MLKDNTSFLPLVVGAPRTGFTLLCSILVHLSHLKPEKYTLHNKIFKTLNLNLGNCISDSIIQTFCEHGIEKDLIYNPAFRFITGGPKWLDNKNPDLAVIRKYIGVKGKGDFTLNIRHPRDILDNDEVVHSHSHPGKWLSESGYDAYTKFSCMRNPVGTLNSSIFSINALTSEYIQRFIPQEKDNDSLRQELALYKFTDLDFFEGLVQFLKTYLEEFLPLQKHYHLMKWEDLINSPVETIKNIANYAQISLSDSQAKEIWIKLDHLNLTGPHKHNYRQGKGIVDDWKNSMTNHHLNIMREYNLDSITQQLGYAPLLDLDEQSYTPFQKQVDTHIKNGTIYDGIDDKDLFTFAFNKSNLVSDKYQFKRYEWKNHTQIERSCFEDEKLSLDVWDIAEKEAENLNALLIDCLNMNGRNKEKTESSINSLYKKHKSTFEKNHSQLFNHAFDETKSIISHFKNNN